MMNHDEKRVWLIQYLFRENPQEYSDLPVPQEKEEQIELLRALFTVRKPAQATAEFYRIQDEYLQEALAEKGITSVRDLQPLRKGLYLWNGDITTLHCDTIVDSAAPDLGGCYRISHFCMDNAVHTYAGIQLRQACARLVQAQGPLAAGQAVMTRAFNLPCRRIIHAVGPEVSGPLDGTVRRELAFAYLAAWKLAVQEQAGSLAIGCLSTGTGRFPHKDAAEIAVNTILESSFADHQPMDIIFVVHSEEDERLYRQLLLREK